MLENDAILSKISIIKRCLETIHKATGLQPESLDGIFIQDVFILNVQRAVQACIDIANILIAQHGWKLPANYKESFSILRENAILSPEIAGIMMKMCGFRNIAVHDYQEITPPIMKTILTHHIKDFEDFDAAIFEHISRLPQAGETGSAGKK